MQHPRYVIRRAGPPPAGAGGWDEPAWTHANVLELGHFYDSGSAHRPRVRARVLYDDRKLYVLFHVADRYVKAVAQKYQDKVCKDSCVEFFVQPKPGGGYLNFEVNAGGVLLLHRFPRPPPVVGRLNEAVPVPFDLVKDMPIHHSMPPRIDAEIAEPCEWTIEYAIPLELFEHYDGPQRPLAGRTWRGNFYKCADNCSHPHWGMWSPVQDGFSFHQPKYFGELVFEA